MGRKLELEMPGRFEAVMALLRREETGGRIALRYGISENTLYRLRDRPTLISRRGIRLIWA